MSDPVITEIVREVYDPNHDEKMIIRESVDIPGLIELHYDLSDDSPRYVSFTVDQALAVASAMRATANEVQDRVRASLRADPSQN